jgi:hypothetical protein
VYAGMVLHFSHYAGLEEEINGETYKIIRDTDILAVLEERPEPIEATDANTQDQTAAPKTENLSEEGTGSVPSEDGPASERNPEGTGTDAG